VCVRVRVRVRVRMCLCIDLRKKIKDMLIVQTLCMPLRLDATRLFLASSHADDSALHQGG